MVMTEFKVLTVKCILLVRFCSIFCRINRFFLPKNKMLIIGYIILIVVGNNV